MREEKESAPESTVDLEQILLTGELQQKISIRGKVYTFCENHLHCLHTSNDWAFRDAGLSEEDKYRVASHFYGYLSETGDWPTCRNNDIEGLNKLITWLRSPEPIENFNIHRGHLPVKLTEEFTAKVYATQIRVGCQVIDRETLEKVLETMNLVRDNPTTTYTPPFWEEPERARSGVVAIDSEEGMIMPEDIEDDNVTEEDLQGNTEPDDFG